MPADPSGVTTDDQSPRGNEADDPAPASTDGRTVSSATTPGTDRRAASGGDSAPAAGDTSGATPAPDPVPANGARGTDPVPDPGAVSTARDTDGPGDDPSGSGGSSGSSGDHGAAAWPDPVPETATQPTTIDPDLGPAGLAGGEPPPAPILAGGPSGPGGRRREGRGRHASKRTDRASRRGLRVNQRLWSIDPWSVFKVSALFYLCLGLIILVAGTLLYNAGRRVGTIDQAESFVTRMGAYGECVAKADVEKGAEFEEDDDKCEEGQVLVGGFALDDGTLFRVAAIGGVVLVVAGSIGNVLLTVLLNLLNELTGGLRHTVVKEPVARQPGNRSARSPNPRRRAPTGSPGRRPQG